MKEILGIKITDEYYDEVMCKQSQGGLIKIIEEQIYCLMPYEEIQNGQIFDIQSTQEYKDKIAQEQNAILKADLQRQIDELDIKRIRAIAEPQLKDAISGQTWLEYYTLQIQGTRAQLFGL